VPTSVAVLVFHGFADWEPAFALTGLRRWGARTVTVFGYDREPVVSMGGLRVLPDRPLSVLAPAETELLLLPGGDAWVDGYPADRLDPVLTALAGAGVPVAGICAATIALARAGLFRGRRHTSNGRAFLQANAPGYATGDPGDYVDALAVTDRGVISASGLGAVEFAQEIFAALGVLSAADSRQYVAMYRDGRTPGD
jgi:putative intracellular protease/amidase